MGRVLIYEPMTAATDLLLAVLAVYFALELGRWHATGLMNVHLHLSQTFWALAGAALLGALSHGLGPHLNPVLRSLIWKTSAIAVGLGGGLFLLSACYHVMPYPTVRLLRWLIVLLLVVYTGIILKDDRFIVVVRFYFPCLVFVLLVMVYSQFGLQNPGAGWISSGVLISFLAAGVQVSGLDLHRHFNHNDLYHLIQLVALYFWYRGGLLLGDFGAG